MTVDFIKYDGAKDELHLMIPCENFQDIVLNKELVLHISKSADGGYIVDLYRHSNWNEEYMFDDDFLKTMYVTEDDLRRDITYKVQVGENEELRNDFHLLGSKLYQDEKQIEENVDEDCIIQTILDKVPDRVTSIEIEGEEIYRG